MKLRKGKTKSILEGSIDAALLAVETSPQGNSERSLLEALISYEPEEPVSGISFPRQSRKENEGHFTFEDLS
ncbi:hypothetical protein F4X88_14480 [Candidatus Poribacteria bacterium]|nr:hypothetical protein [Candidatus Poribacteria bacterium]MYA57497.1 hypothetical protein [Candidatus Poribacteria bacterium]